MNFHSFVSPFRRHFSNLTSATTDTVKGKSNIINGAEFFIFILVLCGVKLKTAITASFISFRWRRNRRRRRRLGGHLSRRPFGWTRVHRPRIGWTEPEPGFGGGLRRRGQNASVEIEGFLSRFRFDVFFPRFFGLPLLFRLGFFVVTRMPKSYAFADFGNSDVFLRESSRLQFLRNTVKSLFNVVSRELKWILTI